MIDKILYFLGLLFFSNAIQAQVTGHQVLNVFGGSASQAAINGVVAMGEVFTGSVKSGNYGSLGIIGFSEDKMMTSFQEDEMIQFITYPNPAIDIVTIDSPKPILKVYLFDTEGRLVISESDGTGKVDVSDLKSGLYYIKLFTKDQKHYSLGWLMKIQQ